MWRRVWVHLWELACQRYRRLVVPAGTRNSHRRQAGSHRSGVVQGVGALVGAGLPAMQTPRCACRNAYQPSPASRCPQGRGGAGRRCTCGSWLASDTDARLCLQERVSTIAGKPAPTGAGWRRVWVHLWELACQRCRRPVVSAGTRINHRRQAGAHRGGVVQGVGALVGAALPAIQTPGCACWNA